MRDITRKSCVYHLHWLGVVFIHAFPINAANHLGGCMTQRVCDEIWMGSRTWRSASKRMASHISWFLSSS